MASMTDFVKTKIIQESSTNEKTMTDEEIATSVLESYMSMTAAFASVDCICECVKINHFCESAEIPIPENTLPYMESFADSVHDLFEKIGEWFRTIIQGLINIFSSSKLTKLIAKLKTMDPMEEIKGGSDVVVMAYGTTTIVQTLEDFKETLIDEIPDQKTVDEYIEQYEKMNNSDYWTKGVIKSSNPIATTDTQHKSSDAITIANLITILEDINKYDIPKRGSSLLKSLKFDKNKYKAKDDNGVETEEIDKNLVRSINKCARLVAKLYDKVTKGLIKVSDKAFGKTEVKDNESYESNLKEANENKKKIKYNDEESSTNRPVADAYFK